MAKTAKYLLAASLSLLCISALFEGCTSTVPAPQSTTPSVTQMTAAPQATPATAVKPLKVYHAGSLATSFGKLEKLYELKNPDTDVQLWSGGSAALMDKVSWHNMYADTVASADQVLIPQNLYPKNATFEVDFAKNTMVLCYTNTSKGSADITSDNWYQVLAAPGVSCAISDPTTDTVGYRGQITICLRQRKYGDSTIFDTQIKPYRSVSVLEYQGVRCTRLCIWISRPDTGMVRIPASRALQVFQVLYTIL